MALPGGQLSPWGRRRKFQMEQPGGVAPARRVRRRFLRPRGGVSLARQFRFPMYFGDQPNRKFCKLKYTVHVSPAGIGVNSAVVYEFRANGMYDPEVALGGHQPYGFDQLMAAYSYFTVLSSTCRAELLDVVTGTNQYWQLMVYNQSGVAAAAFAAGGQNALTEFPVVSRTLGVSAVGLAQGQFRSQKVYANIPKIFGKTAANLIGDSRFQGDASADPTEQVYFALVGYVPGGTVSANATNFKIEIVYNAVFTEPKFFTTS